MRYFTMLCVCHYGFHHHWGKCFVMRLPKPPPQKDLGDGSFIGPVNDFYPRDGSRRACCLVIRLFLRYHPLQPVLVSKWRLR